MQRRMLFIAIGALLPVGCAAPAIQAPLLANSPANANAPESSLPPQTQTLALSPSAPRVGQAVPPGALKPEMENMGGGHDMQHMGHEGMSHDAGMQQQMSSMKNQGMDHNMANMPGMMHQMPTTRPGDNAALSAPRWTPTTVSSTAPTTNAASYVCPMHPTVVSAEPGKCPICGMKLAPKKANGSPDGHVAHDHKDHGGQQ